MRGRAGPSGWRRCTSADEPADAAAGRRTQSCSPRGRRTAGGAELVVYPDELAEARGVAPASATRIDEGVPPETIAVLFRVNSQSALLEHALDEVGVRLARARRGEVLRPARGARGGARPARRGARRSRASRCSSR